MLNSKFCNFFSPVIFCNTKDHKTILKNNFYNHIKSNAIVFVDYENQKFKEIIIKSKDFTKSSNFTGSQEYINLYIVSCLFKNCISTYGGGIFVEQNCSIILHGSIFNSCSAQDGGGCYICKRKNELSPNGEIIDEYTAGIDVQYCCFQNCYTKDNAIMKSGFGSALLLVGVNVAIFYTSTINCFPPDNELSRGAQIDIQSYDIAASNINETGGFAKYCGAIEYRRSKIGFFRFQNMISFSSMFVMAFSQFDSHEIEISYCNLISNNICEYDVNTGTYPSLIHVRKQNIRIIKFTFINNNFGDSGRIVSHELEVTETYNFAILMNCYCDLYIIKENDCFTTISCNFSFPEITQNPLSQLYLGECKGNATPRPFIITEVFSPSIMFSESSSFSKSKLFSFSNDFSNSNIFSFSNTFSDSRIFSFSNFFSNSILFYFPKTVEYSDNPSLYQKESVKSNSIIETQFSHFLKETMTMSYSHSFVKIKSVSFSLSICLTNTFVSCETNKIGELNLCITEVYIPKYLPYIIYYLSPTYIKVNVFIEINPIKKGITQEQLIGIVCGSVAGFFIIISLIIFINKKKFSNIELFEIDILSEEEERPETIQETNETLISINNSKSIINNDDTWL